MPEGQFYSLHNFASWVQYSLAAKNLLQALEQDNPEETLMLQLTISELALASMGLLILSRVFPEFTGQANELSLKITAVNEAQDFLRKRTLDDE